MTASRAPARWLTARAVETLPARAAVVWDLELAGFGVAVDAAGARSYFAEAGGRRIALGRHGEVTAERARRLAAAAIAGAGGAEAATVAALASRYLREYVEVRCKPATVAQYRTTLYRHVVPALGALPVAAVGRAHVADLQHRLADRPAMANQAVAVLSRLIDQAVAWGLVPDAANPCRDTPRYRVKRRERFLTDAEFGRLGRALDALAAERRISVHAAAAIRLLMLTGCRRNEILTLRWDEVRLEAGELRLGDSKTGPRTVPLSPAAARILARIPRIAGNPWVVPGRGGNAPVSGIAAQWRLVRARAGLDDLRLHDLRHSFASRALALGESLPTIARLLGHARVQSTARYAHLARDAVREAAARVADGIGADILAGAAESRRAGAAGAGAAPGAVRASAKRIAERIGADILPR